jgi:flagellar basal body-associated protein FliL
MKEAHEGEKGIVLLVVLMLLTLFGVVGITFTFYAAEAQCKHNPTVEMNDNRCSKEIGNTDRRTP